MKKIYYLIILFALTLISCNTKGSQSQQSQEQNEPLKILVLTERGGQHGGFTDAALKWLDTFSKENNFEYTEINNTKQINEEFLSQYKVIIQLDYPLYMDK